MCLAISRDEDQIIGARSDFGEVVSHVSDHWRSIALDTPSLWTEICHNDPGGAPVDIYVNRPPFEGEHNGHCRSLYIGPTAQEFQQQLLGCMSRYAAPLLSSFSISDFPRHAHIEFSAPLFTSGAPRLVLVQLVGLNFNEAPQVYCLPAFEAVTHLDLSRVRIQSSESYISLRGILVALPSLRHLELQLAGMSTLSHLDQPPTVLPALEILRVVFAEFRTDFDFIHRCIRAPSLFCLSLAGWDSAYKALDETDLAGSHFPSLLCLFLSKHISTALSPLDTLAIAYRHIERLTCRVNHADNIEHLLEALVGNTAEEDGEERTSDGPIQWPKMQRTTVEGLRYLIDASVMHRIALKLRKPGSTIHTLLLPKPCFGDGDVESLKDIIMIEAVIDEWPTPLSLTGFDKICVLANNIVCVPKIFAASLANTRSSMHSIAFHPLAKIGANWAHAHQCRPLAPHSGRAMKFNPAPRAARR
ncbi:hypothetical protein FIBSPDRAFT_896379 [Athelia psychrophila]|uniref:Uncharacterized protein n=1 Tax=Athelia psychrophila TaxID=1759441 RepID=A0A166DEM7_9AGAM|nr:hypothetical protein FIBSPDRAFT_896379 [Fibularhizoctonia sp. CBS 109695]